MLITQKWGDFILFYLNQPLSLLIQKKHLTIEGLIAIVSIRAAINLSLTETQIASFLYISPKYRAIKYKNINIPSPYRFTGFTESEGCFFVLFVFVCCFFVFLSVPKSKSYKVGYKTQLF